MNRRNMIAVFGMMVFAFGLACAQDNTPPSDSQTPQQPVAAYGQENVPSRPMNENPPLSGLDLPSLQEHAAPLSYLQPGATFSESASTNIGNSLGGGEFGSITRGLGTLTRGLLQGRHAQQRVCAHLKGLGKAQDGAGIDIICDPTFDSGDAPLWYA